MLASKLIEIDAIENIASKCDAILRSQPPGGKGIPQELILFVIGQDGTVSEGSCVV
jgi:hypothetical protein